MRIPIIAGNWKLHKTKSEALELIDFLKNSTKEVRDVQIIVAPTYAVLGVVTNAVTDNVIQVAAQNCYPEPSGAYTGEVSALLLRDIGCDHVIIGHSERRQLFNETNDFINRKVRATLEVGMGAILCIGETLDERESGQMFEILKQQVTLGLKDLEPNQMDKLVIAYEPVWAIGTGKTASAEQAQEVHLFIRSTIQENFDKNISDATRIIYGGSVKPDNIDNLMAQPDVDGALVGGASLKGDDFTRIIKFQKV